jgi:hypothetical protein
MRRRGESRWSRLESGRRRCDFGRQQRDFGRWLRDSRRLSMRLQAAAAPSIYFRDNITKREGVGWELGLVLRVGSTELFLLPTSPPLHPPLSPGANTYLLDGTRIRRERYLPPLSSGGGGCIGRTTSRQAGKSSTPSSAGVTGRRRR